MAPLLLLRRRCRAKRRALQLGNEAGPRLRRRVHGELHTELHGPHPAQLAAAVASLAPRRRVLASREVEAAAALPQQRRRAGAAADAEGAGGKRLVRAQGADGTWQAVAQPRGAATCRPLRLRLRRLHRGPAGRLLSVPGQLALQRCELLLPLLQLAQERKALLGELLLQLRGRLDVAWQALLLATPRQPDASAPGR